MMSKIPVIVLVGPTAVGKSSIAVRLAQTLGTELISADSRQIYRYLNIGTDKPDPTEREGVIHHLLDVAEPDEVFSAARFKKLAEGVITRLHSKGRIPLIVGGTGLYVRTLIYGLWSGPGADWSFPG